MYKAVTLINAVFVVILAVVVFRNSVMESSSVRELSALNEEYRIDNQALSKELEMLRREVAELQFESTKPTRRVSGPASRMIPVDRSAEAKTGVQSGSVATRNPANDDIWAELDEYVPHAPVDRGYDSINTLIDWDALESRECNASGQGLIGLVAAMTRKCPDWYLGDGIIIID